MVDKVTSRTSPAYDLWQQAIDHSQEIHKQPEVGHVTSKPLNHVHDTQAQATPKTANDPERLSRAPFRSPYLPTAQAVKPKTALTPQIDPPEPMTVHEREKALSSLESIVKANQVPIDFILQFISLQMIETNTKRLSIYKNLIQKEQRFISTKEQDRLGAMDKLVQGNRSLGKINKVQSATSSLGLLAAIASTMIEEGFSKSGCVALMYGALLTVDLLLDDAGKKGLAAWISNGNKESESAWLGRIQVFTTLTSLGLSLGLSGSKTIQIAKAVSDVTVTGIKGTAEQNILNQRAFILGIENAMEGSKINSELFLQNISDLMQATYNLYENIQHIEESRDQILRGMFQSIV